MTKAAWTSYPLWQLVREKYPEATLVKTWEDSVEFRLGRTTWMAAFDMNELNQPEIIGVWDMSSDLDDTWDALEQEKQERIARFGF